MEPRVRPIVAIARLLDREAQAAGWPERRRRAESLSRRARRLVMADGPECIERDLTVPVEGGTITVRLYRAARTVGSQPLHVFVHGGGWCAGNLFERDPRCREIAVGAACTVASIDYRLAPEHPYPTPPEDCYAALCWLVEHAAELELDTARVAVGGESAGGNLAAVVCLMARDRSGPRICHQWLDVPALDLTLSSGSIRNVPDGHLLDRSVIDEFLGCYLPDRASAVEPYASPLLAEDLTSLPPAWIMACELDKLRDDAIRYAERLRAASVPATCRVLAGNVHPTFAFTRLLRSARSYQRDAIAALRSALHPEVEVP